MPIVVPIHNAVNERVWEKVLEWEREAGAVEGGSKLISFVGKPKDRSPRSLWWAAIGFVGCLLWGRAWLTSISMNTATLLLSIDTIG